MNQIAAVTVVSQAMLFQKLRWNMLRNTLKVLLQGTRLRFITIVLCSLLLWCLVFAIGAEGFSFLKVQKIPLGVVGTLFDLLFLALTVLLIFSSGIIMYGSLFNSDEAAFLLNSPARADQIFAYKLHGSLAFSSWGFLLLGSPVLISFGLVYGAPWYFYPLLLLYFLGFVLLPGTIGALLCLVIVDWLPRQRKHIVAAAVVVAILGCIWWIVRLKPPNWHDPEYPNFLLNLLQQLSFVRGPLAPNHWMGRGLLAASRGDLGITSYCLTLVWSNSLFSYVLTMAMAAKLYRGSYNRVATGGMFRRRYGGAWLDRILSGLVGFLDPQTRLLIVKDFRTFRRDPSQWAQVLIFSALISLYFGNMRRFYLEEIGQSSQNRVSLINLAATALLLCAYTGRFIYPMLSLEGRKFWVLGLLPMRRDQLLWGKFVFSATWSLLISEFLIVFSDLMLGMPAFVLWLHALTVAVLCLGLSGLSVGMGAWMPNFRESDPSKIAIGFGGTLNLVACLLFLVVEILLMAIPTHIRLAYSPDSSLTPNELALLLSGAGLGVVIGLLAALVPLKLGARSLRRMEF